MDIKQIITDKFQKEIKAESLFLSDTQDIKNFINTVCSTKPPYTHMFNQDETRNIFDQGNVNIYFKIVAFLAISQDDTDLYAYLIDNMKWKNGSEIRQSYNAQAPYIQEFKPKKITHWFFNNYKNQQGMMSSLGIHFLYCSEYTSKALIHKIVNNSSFSTNKKEVYEFLAQTKNTDLFTKIINKHMEKWLYSKNNIIIAEIEKNKRYDMLELIYNKFIKTKTDIEINQYIESLNKNGYNGIANIFKNTYFKDELEQNLNVQNYISIKKIKI